MHRPAEPLPSSTDPLPAVDSLLACHPPAAALGAVRELHDLLDSADPSAPLDLRVAWLAKVAAWMKAEGSVPALRATLVPAVERRASRLRFLVEVLSEVALWRWKVRELVASVLLETSPRRLLCETGLVPKQGLVAEALRRVGERLAPTPLLERDLADVLFRLFPSESDARWLEALPAEGLLRLAQVLGVESDEGELRGPLRAAVRESAAILATRAAALGLSGELLASSRAPREGGDPARAFLALPAACAAIKDSGVGPCAALLPACRAVVHDALHELEHGPVDVAFADRMELLNATLDRLETLLWMLEPDDRMSAARVLQQFTAVLIRARAREGAVSGLVGGGLRRAAKKVFEHTGTLGRHYITATRDEWHRMVTAGAGGGALTAITALLKLHIAVAALPLFFEGTAMSLDYAVSFVLIQLLGFTLATKQPSMTGAALAASFDVRTGDAELHGLARQVAAIARSQLAAVIGNVGVVIPVAVLFDLGWRALGFGAVVPLAKAHHVIASMHPLRGATLPFAAFTGVLLWLASVAGGWLENWVLSSRLPERIERLDVLVVSVGAERARRFAAFLRKQACGLGANVALGVLLGMTPVLARFFGLPLDVRHVTLSTGTLTLAGAAIGPYAILEPGFLWAAASIPLIGLMNIGVSFALGLALALRTRNIGPGVLVKLARAVLMGGPRSLRDFVLPPKGLAAEARH